MYLLGETGEAEGAMKELDWCLDQVKKEEELKPEKGNVRQLFCSVGVDRHSQRCGPHGCRQVQTDAEQVNKVSHRDKGKIHLYVLANRWILSDAMVELALEQSSSRLRPRQLRHFSFVIMFPACVFGLMVSCGIGDPSLSRAKADCLIFSYCRNHLIS